MSLGLADVFSSVGIADSFVLFDNLQVTLEGGVGSNYCLAAANTTGFAGTIGAEGSANIAQNDLTLTARDLPANAFGFFLVSPNQGFVQNPSGSAGNLCLSGAIGRYVGPGQIMGSGAAGTFSLTADLTAIPSPNGPIATSSGMTWNFQAWFRDAGPTGPTSNFTNGVEIEFL